MYLYLDDFLDKCLCYEKLVIFNEEENIEDKFEEEEIPEEWLIKRVKDFSFSFGTIWVKI